MKLQKFNLWYYRDGNYQIFQETLSQRVTQKDNPNHHQRAYNFNITSTRSRTHSPITCTFFQLDIRINLLWQTKNKKTTFILFSHIHDIQWRTYQHPWQRWWCYKIVFKYSFVRENVWSQTVKRIIRAQNNSQLILYGDTSNMGKQYVIALWRYGIIHFYRDDKKYIK